MAAFSSFYHYWQRHLWKVSLLAGCSGALAGSLFLSEPAFSSALISAAETTSVPTAQPNDVELADRLFEAGIEHYSASRITEAIASWQQALTLYQRLNEQLSAAETLANLGLAYAALSDFDAAIELGQQSLTLANALGDRNTAANALGNLGSTFRTLGDYAKAITYQEEALSIKQSLGDRRATGYILGNLGNAYKLLGQYNKALEYQQQSLEIAQSLGDRTQERAVLGNIGAVYADQEDYEKAISFYEQSLAVTQGTDNLRLKGYSLANLGNAHHAFTRSYAVAEGYYRQSLEIAQTTGDQWLEAKSLGSLGLIQEGLKDYTQAIELYDLALGLFRTIHAREWTAKTLNNRAHTLLVEHQALPENSDSQYAISAEKLHIAEQNLVEATLLLDDLREELTSDASRVSLFDTQVMTYNLLQQVLIAQGKPEKALEASEAGRSRAFTALLHNNQSTGQTTGRTTGQTRAGQEPFDIAAIQQFARQQNATLVEYSIMPADDVIHQGKVHGKAEEIFTWVIKPTGEVFFRRVPLNEMDLEATIEASLSSIEKRSRGFRPVAVESGRNQAKHLSALHQVLITPIADLLPAHTNEPVTFVGQGSLLSVPFAALIDEDGQYLIEKHTILSAPSIQVLQLAHTAKTAKPPTVMTSLAGNDFLIVGNPEMPEVWNRNSQQRTTLVALPGAEIEAKTVANLFGNEPLLNNRATEQAVRQRISTARVIHLATHGLLEYGNPEDSGVSDVPGAIALMPDDNNDGLLTAAEISTLSLAAELVVLSACDTGLGQVTGDGVIGLSRALLGAGASNVVVSLWSVPDAPTATLMAAFYEQLWQGASKAQALRAAMMVTMENHPDPSAWAAFTLIGQTD